MRDRYFEEYELRIYARVAVPKILDTSKLPNEFFDAVREALAKRNDALVVVTSAMFEPLQEETNERSKRGF